MSALVRAFYAVALEGPALEAATRRLAELRSGALAGAARFVRPEGLHVTLHFLGNVRRSVLPALSRAVAAEVAPLEPFALHVVAPALFPSERRPRAVALALAPEAPLAALAAAVERGVVSAGFAPEPRPFRPHATLARVREGRRPALPPQAALPPDAAMTVRDVVLFESRLERDGSIYTPMERFPLHGPGSHQP